MDSPAHRANMLGAKFTHVGIGVAIRPGEAADLLATLVFVRRPAPPSAPLTPAVATNEGLWTMLTHTVFLDYARARWPTA